jgi:hypothetical protein
MNQSFLRLVLRMTLAWVFAVSILCAFSWSTQAPESTGANQSAPAAAQSSPPAASPASTAPAKSPEATPPSTSKLRHHKRKKASADCSTTPTAAPADAATSSAARATPANCPPAKIIVHNGGTAEPSIQLTGGDASHESATQLLSETDRNLKDIGARQLSSNQQEMVNQIRQFVDQSKAAIDAGDTERARTLALKAQMLSEELIKPQK